MAMPPSAQRPLRFRKDLRVTPTSRSGKREFLIEDRTSGKFHLLGDAEYYLACSFNGQRSVVEVIEAARQKMDHFDLEPPEVAALARWLLAAQIVELPGERAAETPAHFQKLASSILYFRIPFGPPDRWVKHITPYFAWLFTMQALIGVLILAAITGAMIATELTAFTASFGEVFAPDHQWRMIICWLFLKAIHELGHAIACRRFAGEVRDCGVAFFFLAPAPYVDVTSCWRFSSKWERIAVALAGMYIELIAAILAALVWRFSDDPVTRQFCANVISLATLTTLLFNANPLMRYDGYYALSDLLNWPNLAGDGKTCVASIVNRILLGASSRFTGAQSAAPAPSFAQSPPSPGLFLFGIASSLWQTATMLGLAIFAVAIYEGLGVIVACAIGIPMFLGPVTKLGAWLLSPKVPYSTRLRGAGLLIISVALLTLLSLYTPWPQRMRSAGFVEFSEVAVIRAACPGNIAILHVADGQQVAPGQQIATLENAEIVAKAQMHELDADLTTLKARGHLHQQRLSDFRAEDALSEARAQAVNESRRKVESLVIHSPISGVVMARRLADQEGKYLKEGDELCRVAQGQVEIRLSVPQRDLERFQSRIGKLVTVRLPSGTVEGEVISLDPMGSLSALDPALLAPMGGPLAAKANSTKGDNADNQEAWTLPEPHFLAKVRVDNAALPSGFAGQRAEVSFFAFDRTIARQIADFFIARFDQAQSSQGN